MEGEGEEDVAELRKIAHAMRKDVPVGERHIRLRTFYDVVRLLPCHRALTFKETLMGHSVTSSMS